MKGSGFFTQYTVKLWKFLPQYHQGPGLCEIWNSLITSFIVKSQKIDENTETRDSDACGAFLTMQKLCLVPWATRASSDRHWGWFSVSSSWNCKSPCNSLGLSKGCNCLCSLYNTVPWHLYVVGHLLICSMLGLWRQLSPYLQHGSHQTRSLAQHEVCVSVWWARWVFCILCENYSVYMSFHSTSMLLHQCQRGRPHNSFGGNQAVCIKLREHPGDPAAVLWTGGIECILGISQGG